MARIAFARAASPAASRQALSLDVIPRTNASRKIRRRIRGNGSGVYVGTLLHHGEGESSVVEATLLVEIFGDVAARDDLPIQRDPCRVHTVVHPDGSRAVGSQRIVELGVRPERVDALHVFDEQPSPHLARSPAPIDIDFL